MLKVAKTIRSQSKMITVSGVPETSREFAYNIVDSGAAHSVMGASRIQRLTGEYGLE